MTATYLIVLVAATLLLGVFVGWLCRDLVDVSRRSREACGREVDFTVAAARGELGFDMRDQAEEEWPWPAAPGANR